MKKKILVIALALSLVAVSALGVTLAYFTDSKDVTNTFTMGNVSITLTEPSFLDGEGIHGGTVNNVVPGDMIAKDPTVTNTGANDAYVRLKVTITKSSEFDTILPNAVLTDLFSGYDGTVWLYKGTIEDTTANTRTYTFWYNGTLASGATAAPLFTAVNIPTTLTSAQVATLAGFSIIVKAEAIQADNFTDATAAFAALGA